jgi:hypothetical protein
MPRHTKRAKGRVLARGLQKPVRCSTTAAPDLSTGAMTVGKPAIGCNTPECEAKEVPHPDMHRSATII